MTAPFDASDGAHTAVRVRDLVVRYGGTTAVNGISLRVPAGEVHAILGHNGAGKTSVLGTLHTLIRPTSGHVNIFGTDTTDHPLKVRRHLGVVFQDQTLDRELTVERNLSLHARLYGIPRHQINTRISDVLEAFGLTDRRKSLVRELSGGLARRVEIARAILHRPRLLILDEPTTGLDPQSRRSVWRDLEKLRTESAVTILFCTHYMDEAEYADNITILRDGQVAGQGTPRDLKSALAASAIVLRTSDNETARAALVAAGHVVSVDEDDVVVTVDNPEAAVTEIIAAAATPIQSLTVRHPSLDDVFLTMAAASAKEQP